MSFFFFYHFSFQRAQFDSRVNDTNFLEAMINFNCISCKIFLMSIAREMGGGGENAATAALAVFTQRRWKAWQETAAALPNARGEPSVSPRVKCASIWCVARQVSGSGGD